MSNSVALIGAAACPVGRLQSRPEDPIQVVEHEILTGLVLDAVADAGVTKEQIDALVLAQCRSGTVQKYFATFMADLLRLPMDGAVMEVLGNGMTGGLAFDQAVKEVRLGHAEVALALGINMESAMTAGEQSNETMRMTGDVDFHTPFGFTPISWYALDAMRYMHDFGATREQLASVAVKNRRHASLNPLAHFRKPITVEDVVAQRPIVEPLGLYDVPARDDGAVCLVVASEAVAKASGRPYARLRGRGFHHEGVHQISELPNDMTAFAAATRAGNAACEAAGIAMDDIDFAELYAPCTITEVLVSEALGFCDRGRGAAQAEAGETTLGGRIPICPSGGCLSRGHPPFVTPLYDTYECLEQLRGDAGKRQVKDAALALTCCELGNYNAALVQILEAVR